MKRILITSINGKFDELLIEYFISQHYLVRILKEFVDPGCACLKWPVEIYCCSPYDKDEMTYAVRGCDFVIATHCNLSPAGGKNSSIPASIKGGSLKQDLSRLKAVIYLKEAVARRKTGFMRSQRKCIRETISLLNNSQAGNQKGRKKNGVRSIFVDATQAVLLFENNTSENNAFEFLGSKIQEIMLNGRQNEKCIIHIKSDVKETNWKLLIRGWIETGLDRILQIIRLPHNLTGF